MTSQIDALTRGFTGIAIAYVCVQLPMIAGLIQGRAPLVKILVSPVLALTLLLVVAIVTTEVGVPNSLFGFIEGIILSIAAGYAAGRIIAARQGRSDREYLRGAIVSDDSRSDRSHSSRAAHLPAGKRLRPNTPLTLAGLPVAPEDETKHFKLIGTTGTGKSTAIRELLSTALARGDRAVIADPDGGYLSTFYDATRGDVILNPFDSDAVKWTLLGEITNDYDVDQLARSMIPDAGDDRGWAEYARTFFGSVTRQALAAGIDDGELYDLLTQAPIQELRRLLARTPAAPFLEEGNERMFGSVRSITSSAIRALNYTTRKQATPFSIKKWIGRPSLGGGQCGVLFLPYTAGEIAALGSIISAWLRMAIFEALSQAERDQRLWFVVDELDALGPIDGLKDALARLRKFGGRTILGFQSIAQVSGAYGKGAADTIIENCGNTLILRCSASEHGGTAEFASKLIGQREVVHTTQSRTRAHGKLLHSSTTSSEHLKIEPAVMASEIEHLPDLHGLLKFASAPDWKRVRLTPVDYPKVVRGRTPSFGAAPPSSAAGGAMREDIASSRPSPTPTASTGAESPHSTSLVSRNRRTRAAAAPGISPSAAERPPKTLKRPRSARQQKPPAEPQLGITQLNSVGAPLDDKEGAITPRPPSPPR